MVNTELLLFALNGNIILKINEVKNQSNFTPDVAQFQLNKGISMKLSRGMKG